MSELTSSDALQLSNVQKWLTSIMVRPGRLRDRIQAADLNYGINSNELIVSGKLGAEERIGIYARGYVMRLMECMQADFPVLQKLMGEALFDVFASAYLVQLPSHSPSLFDLGKNFPAFLKASQPAEGGEMFALPLELAKLERIRVEVSRSEGLEKLDLEMPDENPMFYLFGAGGFSVSPCLRLVELEFELLDFMRKTEKGEEVALPVKNHNFMAVGRRNYAVNMHQLEPWQWHFLQQLGNSTHQMEAVEKTTEILKLDKDSLSAEMMLWLPVALQRGYIYWKELGE